jgi:hypothetical protein
MKQFNWLEKDAVQFKITGKRKAVEWPLRIYGIAVEVECIELNGDVITVEELGKALEVSTKFERCTL